MSFYTKHYLFLLFTLFVGAANSLAQGPIDGFMKGKGNLDAAVSFSREKASHYFAGNDKIDFSGEISTIGLFAAYGITNWADVIVNIPVVNGKFQDGGIFAKLGKKDISLGNTKLSLIGALGFSFPLHKYPTEVASAIGQQAYLLQPRAIVQYYPHQNFFINLRGGYNYSLEIVPPSYVYSLKAGYFKNKFYSDAWIEFQEGIGGKDYRGKGDLKPNSFRELGVSYIKAGGVLYYQAIPRLGGFIGFANIFTGRNTFEYFRISIGVVLKFSVIKQTD